MKYLSWGPVYFCSAQGSLPTCCPTFYYGTLILKNSKQMYHRIHADITALPPGSFASATRSGKWPWMAILSWTPKGPFQNILKPAAAGSVPEYPRIAQLLCEVQATRTWPPDPGYLDPISPPPLPAGRVGLALCRLQGPARSTGCRTPWHGENIITPRW